MTHKLSRLADVSKVRTFTDLFHKATGISVSVIDSEGTVLADTGWQDVCVHFHGVKPKTRQRCRRNGGATVLKAKAGQTYTVEKCGNGLVDAAMPITVSGEPVANFVAGQFLLQPPYMEFFRRQALQAGFGEAPYMEAVAKVPVIDEIKLEAFFQCFAVLTELLGDAGVKKFADEMDRRKQAEQSLSAKSRDLEELNTALRVLLKQREEDKDELEKNILSNVKDHILPYVVQLKESRLSAEQRISADILETNLKEIISPLIRKRQTFGFAAREITVASLLREGKSTKQIAELLGVSPKAAEFHRPNIRKKLGIDHKKTNLRSYSLSIA